MIQKNCNNTFLLKFKCVIITLDDLDISKIFLSQSVNLYSETLTMRSRFCYNRGAITKHVVLLCDRGDEMRVLNPDTLEKIAKYNIDYQKKYGRAPSFREIMHALKLGSLATVQRYIRALQKSDRLDLTSSGNILPLPQLDGGMQVVIPLIGEIACGKPVFAVENIEESFAFPKSLFGGGELFMLRAKGNSMIDAGINKDDLVVLRRQNTADDGEIVAALIDGEATLKRLFHRGGKIVLHPENKRMKDMIFDNCDIQGVLISCIKMF